MESRALRYNTYKGILRIKMPVNVSEDYNDIAMQVGYFTPPAGPCALEQRSVAGHECPKMAYLQWSPNCFLKCNVINHCGQD